MFDIMNRNQIYLFIVIIVLIIIVIINKFSRVNYFNFKDIIYNHFSIFRNDKSGKIPFVILIDIIFLPIFLSICFSMIEPVSNILIERTLVVFSILTSMLFTVLALLINLIPAQIVNQNDMDLKITIKETFYTLMYEILLAIIIIFICYIIEYIPAYLVKIGSTIFYFFLFSFISGLLVVIRRFYKILNSKMNWLI